MSVYKFAWFRTRVEHSMGKTYSTVLRAYLIFQISAQTCFLKNNDKMRPFIIHTNLKPLLHMYIQNSVINATMSCLVFLWPTTLMLKQPRKIHLSTTYHLYLFTRFYSSYSCFLISRGQYSCPLLCHFLRMKSLSYEIGWNEAQLDFSEINRLTNVRKGLNSVLTSNFTSLSSWRGIKWPPRSFHVWRRHNQFPLILYIILLNNWYRFYCKMKLLNKQSFLCSQRTSTLLHVLLLVSNKTNQNNCLADRAALSDELVNHWSLQ